MRHSMTSFVRPLSWPALFFALLGFCLSLTPSLMPRAWFVQGALSGTCAAAGYGCGALLQWLWTYLEIPRLLPAAGRLVRSVALLGGAAVAALFVWQSSSWQNSVRALMQLAPVTTAEPLLLVLMAAIVFILFIAIGRLFRLMALGFYNKSSRFIPRRLAAVAGILLAILVFSAVANGLLFHLALRMVDSSFREADALIDDDTPVPTDPAEREAPHRWSTGMSLAGKAAISSRQARRRKRSALSCSRPHSRRSGSMSA